MSAMVSGMSALTITCDVPVSIPLAVGMKVWTAGTYCPLCMTLRFIISFRREVYFQGKSWKVRGGSIMTSTVLLMFLKYRRV